MVQNNTTLKQHVSQLEDALARRESSLVDVQTHVQAAIQEKDQEIHEFIKRVQILEDSLQKEKDTHRDVRKQVSLKIRKENFY